MPEYRDVTPLLGRAISSKVLLSEPAMRLIADRGGHNRGLRTPTTFGAVSPA